MWTHFYFSTSFLLVKVWGNYSGITIIENEDHYSVVKVVGGKYEDFGNVDCSQQLFEQGYYDDGTACRNVNIKFMFITIPCSTFQLNPGTFRILYKQEHEWKVCKASENRNAQIRF
jgi:hypothetical protein